MHNRCTPTLRCCQNCRPVCDEEFKQVVNLKKSGLLIYVHNNDLLQKINFDQRQESVILFNATNKDLKRYDYVAELCQYKTKCFKCSALVHRIRNLIDNITVINKNEILGICDHCKRLPVRNKCKRCEYYKHRFLNNETQRYLESEKSFHEWLYNVRHVLLSLLQGQIVCKHNIYLDSDSMTQLDNLLKHINWPKKETQLKSDFLCDFSDILIGGNGGLSSNLMKKIDSENVKKTELIDEISASESTSSCICRYLRKLKKSSLETNKIRKDESSLSNVLLETKIDEEVKQDNTPKKLKKKSPKLVSKKLTLAEASGIHNMDLKKKNNSPKKMEKSSPKLMNKKTHNETISKELILNMIKDRKELKNRMKKTSKPEDIKEYTKIELPSIDLLKKKTPTTINESDSFIECGGEKSMYVTEMIKGRKIVPYCHKRDPVIKNIPMLYQIEHHIRDPLIDSNKSFTSNDISENSTESNESNTNPKSTQTQNNSGIIRYQLSNSEFIDKGWTKLPTIKVMRRMNIYNMVPSDTKLDWFKNHKNKKVLFYASSEKLAEIDDDGCGKWFYKNGRTALDYYSAPKFNLGKRCILYSSGEKNIKNKKSHNVMASFDYLGNGVVYDNIGQVRLKYNQSEGLVIDRKIDPPSRWIWHTLNEPPILFPVFCNTFVDENMIDIELEILRKEKAATIKQTYKPFEIRIKVVKINDFFSLRIVNQSKIYIQFRCENICLKLNVGMFLKNKEIINTDFSEVPEMLTSRIDFTKKL